MNTPSPLLKYLICIGGTLVVGSLSGLATAPSVETWYTTLEKPSFNPPNWIFGPVWTLLYIMMGTAAAMVWTKSNDPNSSDRPLLIYGLQLGLNALWSLVFFGLRSPVGGLVMILFLIAAIVACIALFRPIDHRAARLLYPYLAWVCFATVLNASIAVLN